MSEERIEETAATSASAEAAANDLPASVAGYPPLQGTQETQQPGRELAVADPVAIVPRDPVYISAPPVASVPDHGERLDRLEGIIGRLADSMEVMARLEQRHVHREERRVINEMGVGIAPRSPEVITGRTDLERFAPAVDWLFGVQDAPLPDPQYRRADTIYLALTGDWEWRGNFDRERVALASASPTTSG